MRMFIFLAVLFFGVADPALASSDKLAKAVEMWSPTSVSIDDKIATVVLPQKRITDTMYQSVIGSGVCMRLLSDPEALDGVTEVAILNQHQRQGYVFEGGKEVCETLNEMPIGKSKAIQLLGYTRIH